MDEAREFRREPAELRELRRLQRWDRVERTLWLLAAAGTLVLLAIHLWKELNDAAR